MKNKADFGKTVFWMFALACAGAAVYIVATKTLTTTYLVVALGLLCAGAVVGLLANRLPAEARMMAAVALVSATAAMYSAELYFTFSAAHEPEFVYPPAHDRRPMRTVVADLRKAGDTRAVPIIYPSYLVTRPDLFSGKTLEIGGQEVLPLGGIASRTTVLCNESGYWATYPSDELGFRNPAGLWTGQLDIGVVGDSFSHGNCVNNGEDWVSVVRASHPRILNLAMGGNGPLFELATIKEYLSASKPKIVIWQYLEANETRITAEETIPMLQRYLTEPAFRQGLVSRQPAIDSLLESIVEKSLDHPIAGPDPSKFRFADFVKLAKVRKGLGIKVGGGGNPNLVTLERAIDEGRSIVNGWGGKLYFVYLPTALGLTSKTPPSWYASRTEVVDAAKRAGLTVIDLYPVLAAHPDPLSLFPYRGHFHYNGAGYRIVADTILEQLRQDNALAQTGFGK